MQILLNCAKKPSFQKKKSVFMGEGQAPVANAQPAEEKAAAPVAETKPTVAAPAVAKAPVESKPLTLPQQPAQDVFVKKAECKDCK